MTMPFDGVGALGLIFQLRVDNRVPMLVLTLRSALWGIAAVIIYPNTAAWSRSRSRWPARTRLARSCRRWR